MLGVVRQSHRFKFGITTPETCKAVIGIDLSDQPLPIGAAFHMLPNALPSRPKGLDKRLFKPPYSKTLTPPNHPSEVGLPWLAHQEQLAKAPAKGLTSWGWDLLVEQVTTYLKTYEATFAQNAQDALAKVQLGGCDKEYVSAVKTYALSAHKLLTPVNIWMIPYPTGHAAVFASPNKLSLVSADS